MPRHQRQLEELRDLCRHGAVARATDLAFEHFARFGPDDEVIDLLTEVIARTDPPDRVRHRFVELCSSYDGWAGTD